ncbi:MAG: phosphopantetheine-binding protein [Candidatus Cloacimonetes bacterium]|nr:phosphopantetheine-binding protein [Candidatus Cloacimonadota bacterium]MCK9333960.1 phosphopantetheine-binding protein [Candidatus Cloacimonadota bacterium]
MTTNEFMVQLADLIEIDDALSLESNLKDYDEYDSMAIMSLVAFVHKNFGKQFNARQLNQVDTVESLVELIGRDSFSA